ncbi:MULTISPECIES: bifunctional 2-polyprenyl-6-hydroxyphenol methylase/3-demethylubiquinol 3-O-methyltransferase UbiG [Protofrankia]|uniref:class I SAM-dependent methyltransferase n=1 Tax=Protofrankia TaxID=2994361 RepID=UPI00069A4C6E|nr:MULTISPECIES: class I SAM-dependent methyltransferase [Protofrankia]ONH36816.1 methylase [Protofrankia sp. BMG5.30]
MSTLMSTEVPTDPRSRGAGNKILLDLIRRAPGRALDCGCGAGDSARLLAGRGWSVTGITSDPAALAVAERVCETVHLYDLTKGLPFAADGSYDLVLLSHVLEHLADPAGLLAEARRVVAGDGLVVVALPNVLHYSQRVRFVRGRFEYSRTGVMDTAHLRFFTFDSALRLVRDSGLDVVTTLPDGGLPWRRLHGVLPSNVTGRLDRWAVRRRPNLLCSRAVFLARPLPSWAA